MSLAEHFIWAIQSSLGMLKGGLSDLSDADFMARPVPAANHPNWQLGHLIASQHRMVSGTGAKLAALPAGFEEKYKKDTAGSDNAGSFAKKDELIALLDQVNEGTVAYLKTVTPEQLAAPGPEAFRSFAPTMADVISVQPMHMAMHLGQVQVLRRKLGKPILF